jgi:tetratricopeptide (TPR) repeat protein
LRCVGVRACFVSGHQAAAEGPSFDCGKARLPDEIAICRTPELAEFDSVIAAAYAYLKSTRGRAYADQVGIPFWRLRQSCQYDAGCIRQVQIQAINAYQAAGAPISVPQRPLTGAFEATTPQDPSAELRLCRNSSAAADKIAHCSNVIANFNNASALVVARNIRGLALMDVGRYCDAVGDFTFVIEREPRIAGYFDNRQNALRQCGRLDEALRDANEAIKLAPTYSFVFRGRANLYRDMGKYDLAVTDYDIAIQLAPNDGGLFIDRGKVLRTQSKFDQAISDFNHALDLDKKWTAAYRERGLTYKLMGQSSQAIDDLMAYDRQQPGDQDVAVALTELGSRQPSSGSDNPPSSSVPAKQPPSEQPTAISGATIVPMVSEGGTFVVPVRIND